MIINHVLTNVTSTPFDNPHIKKLMAKYVQAANHNHGWRSSILDADEKWAVDPFARCSITSQTGQYGPFTISNDINQNMPTDYHMEANVFCETIITGRKIGLVFFDPPYTLRLLKDHYLDDSNAMLDTIPLWQTHNMWGKAKDALARNMIVGGYVISFGYHTHGFGKHRGFIKKEILICEQAGSPDRYDLLVTVEQKVQMSLSDVVDNHCDDEE